MGRLLKLYRRLARLDQAIQRRFTPLGRFALGLAVLSGLFALDTRRTLSYQLFSLLVALLLVSFLMTLRTRPAVRLRRHLPPLARAGEPFTYVVEVQATPRAETLWVHDRLAATWPDRAQLERDRRVRGGRLPWFAYRRWYAVFTRLRGADSTDEALLEAHSDRSASVQLELRPRRRGHLHFQHVQVGSTDPLGLCRSVRAQPLADSVLVLPAALRVTGPTDGQGGRHHGLGESVSQAAGHSDVFRGLRDYRPGDPPRHIHWKAWARRGEPVVRDFHATAERRQCIVLDHYGVEADEPRFEAAVQVAAGVAEWLAREAEAPVLALDGRVAEGEGPPDLLMCLRSLATVAPAPAEAMAALPGALESARSRLGSLVLVLTAWSEGRRELVGTLRSADFDVRVVVVDEAAGTGSAGAGWSPAALAPLDPGPMADCPQRLVHTAPDRIADGVVLPA